MLLSKTDYPLVGYFELSQTLINVNIMEIGVFEILVALGIPGVAFGVLFFLFRALGIQIGIIPRPWRGPLALVFLLIVGLLVFYALNYYRPDPDPDPLSGNCKEYIELGRVSLSDDRHTIAVDYFKKATNECPTNWKPLHYLSNAEYQRGNYVKALEYQKAAFELDDKKSAYVAYRIGLILEKLERNETAIEYLKMAKTLSIAGTELLEDINFDLGLVSIKQWISRGNYEGTINFNDSELSFLGLIESGAKPDHWIKYHLSCLYASRLKDSSLSIEESGIYKSKAIRYLEEAVSGLISYQSLKAPAQQNMMKLALTDVDKWEQERGPGEPLACPALLDLPEENLRSILNTIN